MLLQRDMGMNVNTKKKKSSYKFQIKAEEQYTKCFTKEAV